MCFFRFVRFFFGRELLAAVYTMVVSNVFLVLMFLYFYRHISDCGELVVTVDDLKFGTYKFYKCSQRTVLDQALFTAMTHTQTNDATFMLGFWIANSILWTVSAFFLLAGKFYFRMTVFKAVSTSVWIFFSFFNIGVNFLFLTVLVKRYFKFVLKLDYVYFSYWRMETRRTPLTKHVLQTTPLRKLLDVTGVKVTLAMLINTVNLGSLVFLVLVSMDLVQYLMERAEARRR